MLERTSRRWDSLEQGPLPLELAPEMQMPPNAEPHVVDEVLQRVRRLSQRLRGWLMRLLRMMDDNGLFQELKFAGLGHYGVERLLCRVRHKSLYAERRIMPSFASCGPGT